MPKEIPTLTITADDPHFLGLVRHYIMFIAAQVGLDQDKRAKRLEELEALIKRGREYQREQGTRKPELEKKRQWAAVKE